ASMSRKRVRRSRFPLATNRWLQSRSGIRVIRPCCPHEYLGFGAGTDFESKLVVKRNAAALLREAFLKPSWTGELVVFSGVTDCYQPVEASFGLTRACLEVCAEFRNPVAIITKAALILRDLDLLRQLHEEAAIRVFLSIPFADDPMARKVEPQAPSVTKRLATLKT